MPRIEAVLGDITQQRVDAIVNAANHSLLGGGGVDGAIHRVGGPAILAECRQLRATSHPRGLESGDAVATGAGLLAARWVIHAVGPIWTPREDLSAVLERTYRRSLEEADALGAATVAFPAISAGVFGWPVDDAARLAVQAVRSTPTSVELVRSSCSAIRCCRPGRAGWTEHRMPAPATGRLPGGARLRVHAPIAQLVEQPPCKRQVAGSNPVGGS